jgi:LacI family transcriptional regulator
MAIHAIQALYKAGRRVPEDVQVIGFDDIELAQIFKPYLTTVSQSRKKIGEYAVKTLMKLINKEELEQVHRKIDVKLVERSTTK